MKVCLADINKDGNHLIYKDFNGGLGTRFEVGNSFLGKIIENSKKKSINLPILSLGYAAAIFSKYGHQVSYADEAEDISRDANLIIYYVSIANCENERRKLKKIKDDFGGKICLIGPFAASVPSFFDGLYNFIIKGEPETFFEKIAQSGDINYEGIVASEPYRNLDDLVFPDWSAFPYQSYSYFPNIIGQPVLPFLSSRGCMYGCDYCAYRANFRYGQRSVENVLRELELLKENYKIRGIIFRDPIFTGYKKRTMELLKRMMDKNLKIQFACETRLDHLDFELVDVMDEAGCVSINVGIESFNDEILKQNARKPIEKQHQEKIVAYCNKKGISISAFYILGFPHDTEKNIMDTISYAKSINTLNASFNVLTPYPGTEAYDKNKDLIIEHDFSKYSFYHPIIKYDRMTSEQILRLKEYAFISFYFRLKYLFFFLRAMAKKYFKYVFIYRHF